MKRTINQSAFELLGSAFNGLSLGSVDKKNLSHEDLVADLLSPALRLLAKECSFPNEGYLREKQLLGDRKATPPIPPMLPVSHGTFWKMVREERFPKPIKLSSRITVWRVSDVRAFFESFSSNVQR